MKNAAMTREKKSAMRLELLRLKASAHPKLLWKFPDAMQAERSVLFKQNSYT